MNSDKFYQIALTLVPKVGDVAAKKTFGLLWFSRKSLMSMPGVGSVIVISILSQKSFGACESELCFIEKIG